MRRLLTNSPSSASPFATAWGTCGGSFCSLVLAFSCSPMPSRSNTLRKCLPLTLSGRIATDLASEQRLLERVGGAQIWLRRAGAHSHPQPDGRNGRLRTGEEPFFCRFEG